MKRRIVLLLVGGVLATMVSSLAAAMPARAEVPILLRTLTLTKVGTGWSGGHVTANGIDCGSGGADCSQAYLTGTTVTLTAEITGPKTEFVGWANNLCDQVTGAHHQICTVTMSTGRELRPWFDAGEQLTVEFSGSGTGTVHLSSGNGSTVGGNTYTRLVPDNGSATLKATPAAGSYFAGFTGACTGAGPECTFTMTDPATVTARFELGSPPAGGGATPPPAGGGSTPTPTGSSTPPASGGSPASGTGCTITGTAGNDTLTGTPGRDVICGLGGHDVIKGLGGNDVLSGGLGNDRLIGGTGADVLLGGAGLDRLLGGAGKDVLRGGAGADRLFARDQLADRVEGGLGRDRAQVDVRKDRRTGIEGLF